MQTCKKGLHAMTPDNVLWKVDKRKKGGGSNVCAACLRENHRLASERRRAGWRKQNTKRYDKVRGRKYRGPNQLTEDVAWRIIMEELTEPEAVALANQFAPTIAAGRLRFTPEPPRDPYPHEVQWEVQQILEVVNKLGTTNKKNPLAHLNVKHDAERAWDRFNKALEEARTSGVNVPNCQDKPAPYADYDEENIPSAEDAYGLCFGCPLIELCSSYAEQERPAWGVWAGEAWAYGEIVNNE